MNGTIELEEDEIKLAIALYLQGKGFKLRPILSSSKIEKEPGASVFISHQVYDRDPSSFEYSASVNVMMQ